MRLLSLNMIWSVAINGTFRLKWRHYGQKGHILDYRGTLIFWFIILLYPIKGYKFIGLKMCTRRFFWENGVSGK